MNLNDKITVSESAMARQVGEETVILDLASGTYFGLDPVGGRIWALMGEGRSLAGILDAIVAEYDVDRDQAESDLMNLGERLRTSGLVSIA